MSAAPVSKIRWGIVSTGAIAQTFARNLAHSETGVAIAVASRDQQSAEKFGDEFNIARRYSRYEDLMADADVQAVYIATPHPMHATLAIQFAAAKKHLLVEKPLAINHAQASAIVEAAIANDVFLMEAFMYRCHPQTARLIELIRNERAIGDVRLIRASFGFKTGFNRDSRIFSNALAGGGIMDVGCYTASMARLIAGAAIGKDFSDPIEVSGAAHLGETGVDEWAIASLKFPGEISAQLSTSVSLNQQNEVMIFGSEGRIHLPDPWTADRAAPRDGKTIVHRDGESPREINVAATKTAFSSEADVVGRAILAGQKQAASPAMSWGDSLGNLRTLDRWRDAIGLVYEFERPPGYSSFTLAGKTLAVKQPTRMKFGRIDGIDKPIARLVMGCDNQRTFAHAAALFDDYFKRGGNTFDTAYGYGGGISETIFGQWMKHRGVRDQVVVIAKGAHTPDCDPMHLKLQLRESLSRQQIDSADLYLMHRDNLEIPVGEFIDVLNEAVKLGQIKRFGASNWTLPRIDEANEYAKQNGMLGFSAISHNFSLARMVNPPWRGCISLSDAESRRWLKARQMPLFSWSSQARGFFVRGRAAPEKRDDPMLFNSWYSDDNFQRLARATDLAGRKNVDPINVALAYVLHQPFPTFALIGPRELSETRSSMGALDIELTEQETRWLNLEV